MWPATEIFPSLYGKSHQRMPQRTSLREVCGG